MPCSRTVLEQRERAVLAPYAQLSAESRGRLYPEEPPQWRTHYQRDRDRVIHSRAFRRLEYKTQVFLNGSGDHLRTRLTHTMEVAAISRNIARALGLNEDLTETIALAHDLGHSPFGHKGEEVLNRLMKEHDGFEHNRQSLRVVEVLEQKYPGFPGLNLTAEVREGLAKHQPSLRSGRASEGPTLEAQVANLADEIAYYSHDLDDGLEAELLDEAQLRRNSEIWAQAARAVRRQYGVLPDECRRYFTIRCIIDRQVRDVVTTTEHRLTEAGITSAEAARRGPEPWVQYSPAQRRKNLELRRFLYANLYYNPVVHEPNLRAIRMLEELFRYSMAHPKTLPTPVRRRARKEGWPRAICDHLSGMTDRSVMQAHHQLFGRPQPSLGRPVP